MSDEAPRPSSRSKAGRYEQLKLSATLFNNVAVAFLLAALLQPVLRTLQENAPVRTVDVLASFAFGAVGAILHIVARRIA